METGLSLDYDSCPGVHHVIKSGQTQATLVTDIYRTLVPGYVASHVGGGVLETAERKLKTALQVLWD